MPASWKREVIPPIPIPPAATACLTNLEGAAAAAAKSDFFLFFCTGSMMAIVFDRSDEERILSTTSWGRASLIRRLDTEKVQTVGHLVKTKSMYILWINIPILGTFPGGILLQGEEKWFLTAAMISAFLLGSSGPSTQLGSAASNLASMLLTLRASTTVNYNEILTCCKSNGNNFVKPS